MPNLIWFIVFGLGISLTYFSHFFVQIELLLIAFHEVFFQIKLIGNMPTLTDRFAQQHQLAASLETSAGSNAGSGMTLTKAETAAHILTTHCV